MEPEKSAWFGGKSTSTEPWLHMVAKVALQRAASTESKADRAPIKEL